LILFLFCLDLLHKRAQVALVQPFGQAAEVDAALTAVLDPDRLQVFLRVAPAGGNARRLLDGDEIRKILPDRRVDLAPQDDIAVPLDDIFQPMRPIFLIEALISSMSPSTT